MRTLVFLLCSLATAFAQAPTPPPTDLPKDLPAPKGQRPPPPAPANPALPTLWVAGDSTAARGRGEHQQGWAVPLAEYFDATKLNVVNRALGGRSSRTFITEGWWDKLLADLKSGDVVLIQFGHNDASPVNEASSIPRAQMRSRGTIPGLGEETQEIDNVLNGKHETIHTFGWYMRKMIDDVKAKGARPIVLSPTIRNKWEHDRVERGPGRYREWSYEVAKAAAVPFIDVSTMIADKFDALGETETKKYYEQDFVHFNLAGAVLHAEAAVAGLKGLRVPVITKSLSAKGEAVPADKFVWLRLGEPANPALPSLFLVGDSTVRQGQGDGSDHGEWGWGDYVASYFDLNKINVVNRAVGGTGVQTYMAAGHWDNVLNRMKPGDVVMIQFGHNDNPPRGPLPGLGEETGERENPRTKEKQTLHTWGWYLRKYVADARAKGATPIICSLVPRKIWKDGKIARNKDTFAGWAQQVAAAEHVPFIDLNELIAQRYDLLSHDDVMKLFPTMTPDEHTHTNRAGAELSANVVVTALRALADDPVAAYLRPERKTVSP